MQNVRASVKSFILTTFLPKEPAEVLSDDAELYASGVLDSLGVLKLVSYVEAQFGIEGRSPTS